MRLILTILTACPALVGSLTTFGPLGTAYGALCAVCFWAAWCDHEWRAVGAALALSWLISNIICIVGVPADRPSVYSGAEILVLMSAFVCWFSGRHVVAARALALVSFISIVYNVLFAASSFKWPDIHAHEFRTNVAFAIECLIVGAVGVADRGYINRLFNRRGAGVAPNVHAQEASDK
jgi:hypothetical protein